MTSKVESNISQNIIDQFTKLNFVKKLKTKMTNVTGLR